MREGGREGERERAVSVERQQDGCICTIDALPDSLERASVEVFVVDPQCRAPKVHRGVLELSVYV